MNRKIPYVHCFNHRLRLVHIHAIKNIDIVTEFFQTVKLIYDFLDRHKVKKIYEGTKIHRLIDTRWCGHYRAVKRVFVDFSEILSALKSAQSLRLSQEDKALAFGIENAIQKIELIFILIVMEKILHFQRNWLQ